jgi:hypothetical protein
MTQAKIATNPADGHGLVTRLTEPLYTSLSRGEPVNQIVAIVVLDPVGSGQRKTAKGNHRHVMFEVAKLEPILDASQAGELRYTLQALYEHRTSTGEQRMLPIAFPGQKEKEKQRALMERIDEWATDKKLTGGELADLWRSNFGIGPGEEYSYGDRGVPGDYTKSPSCWLSEFAWTQGIIGDDEHDETAAPDPAPDPAPDDDDDDGAAPASDGDDGEPYPAEPDADAHGDKVHDDRKLHPVE